MWSNLTTIFRQERLYIDRSWRIDGSQKWRNGDQYLSDGAATYKGSNEAFVNAASGETPFTTIDRPKVTTQGVQKILDEIQERGGNTL